MQNSLTFSNAFVTLSDNHNKGLVHNSIVDRTGILNHNTTVFTLLVTNRKD